jgi:hypothetical protein
MSLQTGELGDGAWGAVGREPWTRGFISHPASTHGVPDIIQGTRGRRISVPVHQELTIKQGGQDLAEYLGGY